jgi:flagellar hook assembly protein FlgD
VRTLINTKQQAGEHRITWDGKDNQGDQIASGIYIYRLQAEGFDQTKKMLFIQ